MHVMEFLWDDELGANSGPYKETLWEKVRGGRNVQEERYQQGTAEQSMMLLLASCHLNLQPLGKDMRSVA